MVHEVLDFERPIEELRIRLESLRMSSSSSSVDLVEEISSIDAQMAKLTAKIFSSLSPWQKVQLSRHPKRPYTLDYIRHICSEFHALHGDRHFGDDKAIVGGLATIDDTSFMVIGHQKGRETNEKVARNFGMPNPEGYRKALRLMQLAERYGIPVVTFIDTPGAYPGIGAEERGQSEAIAFNLQEMSTLQVPIVSIVIGEGGSGGALAIGVCDRLLMLQYATYSVISPEGCASILWRDAAKAPEAAEAMKIHAEALHELKLVDTVIKEPLGGAHNNVHACAMDIKQHLLAAVDELGEANDQLLEQRLARWSGFGR